MKLSGKLTATALRILRRSRARPRDPRARLPALGALAAEPLYVLADTAIVGHLGVHQLAALGLAGAVSRRSSAIFNFLELRTTAQVARSTAPAGASDADEVAAQALWLALASASCSWSSRPAPPARSCRRWAAAAQTGHFAVTYLRIAAIGLPFVLVTLAGQGYLRGVSNLAAALIVVAGNVVNLVLELLFVYGFHWGIAGSAAGTAIAQAGMGAAFAWQLLRRRGDALAVHRDRMLRAAAHGAAHLRADGRAAPDFVFGSAVVARSGAASLGAHQVAFQLWIFLALILDAIAIAGQVIVGRTLGAGDGRGTRSRRRRG